MKIGIAGRMAAGKTTAALALVAEMGFQKFAFADELKRVAVMIPKWIEVNAPSVGWVGPSSLTLMCDKTTPLGRAWLQWLGTECLRTVLDDIWVQAAFQRTKNIENVVIDDVRFRNEFLALKQEGYSLLRVECPESVRQSRIHGYQISKFSHISETDLDGYTDWDGVIQGDLPLDVFRTDVVRWVQRQRILKQKRE